MLAQVLLCCSTALAHGDGRARIEGDRVVGHVDYDTVDVGGRSFTLDELRLAEGRRRAVLSSEPAGGCGSCMAEYLLKFKSPVRRSLIDRVRDTVERSTEPELLRQPWWHPVSRNTFVAYITEATAVEIESSILKPRAQQRVAGDLLHIGRVTDEIGIHLKIDAAVAAGEAFSEGAWDTDLLLVQYYEEVVDEEAKESKERLDNRVRAALGGVANLDEEPAGPHGFAAKCKVAGACVGQFSDAAMALSAAAGHGWVAAVSHPSKAQTTNLYSRSLMQTGQLGADKAPYVEPYSEMLSGEGHVVGVMDTGIDHDHCFFRDDDVPTPIDKLSPKHRKIVKYVSADDSEAGRGDHDSSGGHGTHVAGTIAGDLANGDDNPEMRGYKGFVHKAKLVFMDVAGHRTTEGVNPPHDIKTGFQVMHDAGAYVHSNSWGSATGTRYDTHSVGTDAYSVSNREDLVVYAAGNEADKSCAARAYDPYCDKRTVMAPCVAKNSLCVGASRAPMASFDEIGLDDYFLSTPGGGRYLLMKGLEYGAVHPELPAAAQLAAVVPENGCQQGGSANDGRLDNAAAVKGKLAVVRRGQCYFQVKVSELQEAGAIGVIVVNNVAGDPIVMGTEGTVPVFNIPAFMISKKNGNKLLEELAETPDMRVGMVSSFLPSEHRNTEDMTEFSSRGPTNDFRFKPEVVAIGHYVLSARSDANTNTRNCDRLAESGTSMATPQVAALAVQMRQWLQEGYYPTGVLGAGSQVLSRPSGALIKAMLVQSAVPLTGMVDRNAQGDWEQLSNAPSFYQGFGRVNLASVLGRPDAPLDMFIDDGSSIPAGGEANEFCIRHSDDRYGFRATLVWTDPVAPKSAALALINDLDLTVMSPDGRVWLGNAKGDPSSHVRDVVNNVEKVSIPKNETRVNDVFRVKVTGFAVSSAQPYAVVAAGERVDCGEEPICSGSSACPSGVQSISAEHNEGETTLRVWGWRLYRYTSPTGATKSITVTVTRNETADSTSDIDIYIRKNAVPTLYSHDADYDTRCVAESCYKTTVKRLEKAIVGDAAGDSYFIGIHAGCCHDAVFSLRISTADASAALPPRIATFQKSVTDVPSTDLHYDSDASFSTPDLFINGENLGKRSEIDTISITYTTTTGAVLPCTVVEWLSESMLHCKLQQGSFSVTDSKVTVRVGGYTVVSSGGISIEGVAMTRYEVKGLRSRPCDEGEACVATGGDLVFNSFIASRGQGDVYIVGQNIGERSYDGNPAAVVTYQTPDGRAFPCTNQAYLADSILHCVTSSSTSEGKATISIAMHSVSVPSSSIKLRFEGPVNVTGVSLLPSPFEVQSLVVLTFAQTMAKTVVYLQGQYLGSEFLEWLPYGMSRAYDVPEPELEVTYGRYPNVADCECDIVERTAIGEDRTYIGCIPEVDCLLGEKLYFRIVKYGDARKTYEEATILQLPPPVIQGMSIRLKDTPLDALQVTRTMFSSETTRTIFVHGSHLSVDSADTITVVFLFPDGSVAGTANGTSISDTEFTCILPEVLAQHEATTFSVHFAFGGFVIKNHTCSVAVVQPSTVDGVSHTAGGLHYTMFSVPAGSDYLFVYGAFLADSKDPVITYGPYACPVVAATPAMMQCMLTPRSSGKDLKLVVTFGSSIDIAAGTVSLSFPAAEGEPAGGEYKATPPPVVAGELFTYRVEDADPDGLLAIVESPRRCYEIGRFAPAFFVPGQRIKITDGAGGAGRLLCYSPRSEGTTTAARFWFEVGPLDVVLFSAVVVGGASRPISVFTPSSETPAGSPLGRFRPDMTSIEVRGKSFDAETCALTLQPGRCQHPAAAGTPVLQGVTRSPDADGGEASVLWTLDNPGRAAEKWYLCAVVGGATVFELGFLSNTACVPGSPDACNGRGTCTDDGSCACFETAKGEACQLVCPTGFSQMAQKSEVCSGVGTCLETGVCECKTGFFDRQCGTPSSEVLLGSPKVGSVGSESRALLHVGGFDASVGEATVDFEWYDGAAVFMIYTWAASAAVENLTAATGAFTTGSPTDSDAAEFSARFTAPLSETPSPEIYIGIYGGHSSAAAGSEATFKITVYGRPPAEKPVPETWGEYVQRISSESKATAAAGGAAVGVIAVVLTMLVYQVCRLVRPAWRGHRQLEDPAETVEMSENNDAYPIEEEEEAQLESDDDVAAY
ncbi:Serine protease/ABC transporter B family protein tagC [Diplonema papillatum]|nr:Serine protease/ABC transporter B family protein tagC [Diplonema papillatum]